MLTHEASRELVSHLSHVIGSRNHEACSSGLLATRLTRLQEFCETQVAQAVTGPFAASQVWMLGFDFRDVRPDSIAAWSCSAAPGLHSLVGVWIRPHLETALLQGGQDISVRCKANTLSVAALLKI